MKDVNIYDWSCLYNNLTEVDHDFKLQVDTIGDYEVINGTQTYICLECSVCGLQKEATYADTWDEDYEY